ncbi:MAG TPA: hypothetical protein VND98_03135 [Solirubrobacterales bacterium]|nr:hypothetical protein [Solirubrobacterales bacterium]
MATDETGVPTEKVVLSEVVEATEAAESNLTKAKAPEVKAAEEVVTAETMLENARTAEAAVWV